MPLRRAPQNEQALALPHGAPADPAFERHYSVAEIVELWGLSEKTVRRIFGDEAGVLEWGHDEDRFKRCYKTLRIPESVVQRVHRRMRKVS
jgi:AraC-like DNA-binding protein